MNRTKFIKESISMLNSMAPHIASRKTATMLRKATEELRKDCIWTFDNDGYYQTTCGNGWSFEDGGIRDNGVNFCPYCGGIVIET